MCNMLRENPLFVRGLKFLLFYIFVTHMYKSIILWPFLYVEVPLMVLNCQFMLSDSNQKVSKNLIHPNTHKN
jgi:hypothetical protein